MGDIHDVIAIAEGLLPGEAQHDDTELDPRWQAIIAIGDFIEVDPDPIWVLIVRWGAHPDDDLRAVVATCLLEHLLEYHFAGFFPLVERAVEQNSLFADTFRRCGKFGQSDEPGNAAKFDRLRQRATSIHDSRG
jgi:hypothetical protein